MDFAIFLIAFSLALDCFVVSLFISSSRSRPLFSRYELPIFFGIFHVMMTLIGYFFGSSFKSFVSGYDHWIAFLLLLFIGLRMIGESWRKKKEKLKKISLERIMGLSFATSVDALAVGIVFSLMDGGIFYKSLMIGNVTFLLSLAGVVLGRLIKSLKLKFLSFFGGLVIIGIGLKILVSHTL